VPIDRSVLTDCVDNQFELLVLVLVVILGVFVEDGDVNTAQDYLQVQAGRTGKSVLNLRKNNIG
jgi:hypothetical protein